MNKIDGFGDCPNCGEAWSYTHEGAKYSRIVSLYDPYSDRTEGWQCPDCAHTWPREAVSILSERASPSEGQP